MELDPTVFVHPLGVCESDRVGARTRVWAFAHVMKGAQVGADCNLGDHTFVEAGARIGNHVTVKNGVSVWFGVTIEDDAFLGPNCVFTNDLHPRAAIAKGTDELVATVVRQGATIGANATVVCGHEVGRWAFVGAGAVVVANVVPHALVVGNPAHRVGWVCVCGERLRPDLGCGCGRHYRLVAEEEGLEETTTAAGHR